MDTCRVWRAACFHLRGSNGVWILPLTVLLCGNQRRLLSTHTNTTASSLVSVWQERRTQWWETDFPIKCSRAADPQLSTHAEMIMSWKCLTPHPRPFSSPARKVLGRKKCTRSILRTWLVNRATPRWTTKGEELWMVGFCCVFFLSKYPQPPPLEERGECHCHGNLIYHKRIPFVTSPNGRAAQPWRTHKKKKQGSEERKMN